MSPVQKPGRSRQDYETPSELIDAITRRFGRSFAFDLAATPENAKAPRYLTPADDALVVDWSRDLAGDGSGFGPNFDAWLNPPYADIEPWAERCALFGPSFRNWGGRIFLLTPASPGAEWFAKHVFGKALVLALRPRLTFVGAKDPYPKDCFLSVYGVEPGFDLWRWR